MISSSIDERESFYDLYLKALENGNRSVCVQRFSVTLRNGVPCDAKVFMMVFPVIGKGRVDGSCIFVGFQMIPQGMLGLTEL